MKMRTGMLVGCVVVAACGGSKPEETRPRAAPAPTEMPPTEPAAFTPPTAAPVAVPVAEAPKVVVPVKVMATAELVMVKGAASLGTLTFVREDAAPVSIRGEFHGLKKNSSFAFYIHQNGDCSNQGKRVGAHLDPTKAKHGPPASSQRHAGDLGNLTTDDAGAATFTMDTDSITIDGDRPDSVVNRTIVIHAQKDDKRGSGGPALACGVITLSTP